jgi:hypothetical protein
LYACEPYFAILAGFGKRLQVARLFPVKPFNALFASLISYQLAVLFSHNKPAKQPGGSTLLSKQTSTSYQPPANRTGCKTLQQHK